MAIIKTDFEKIWASTSPLTPYNFSESNYKEGWNFIGATPPARQMWDFLQKNNDEKMKFLLDYTDTKVPPSIGSSTIPTYTNANGVVTASNASVGNANTPVYMDGGEIKSTGKSFSSYLPLAGGTMTGAIKGSGGILIAVNKTTSYLQINGGELTNDGAKIILFGKDEATRSGRFYIDANDGTNSKRLEGYPDGTFKWDGKNIARDVKTGTTNGTISVNGSDVSVYGLGSNAFDSTSYLPLAGGSMTGVIWRNGGYFAANPDNTSYLTFAGGSNTSNGAFLSLYGKNNASAGWFILSANDGTNAKQLQGKPDGTLTWDGKSVQTSATFTQEALTDVSYSLGANEDKEYSTDASATGKTPIAIVGIRTLSINVTPMQWWLDGTTAYVHIRNLTASAVTGSLRISILYAKS